MKTIPLGQTNLLASRLAYGCWRIATGDDAQNYATTKAAVFAALDVGFNLFDHADIYCNGQSEAMFGRILRENNGLRDQMIIATKCGIRPKNQPHGTPTRYDFSCDYILSQCELSLQRLGVDRIDLLHLHRPDYLMHAEEVATAFQSLRDSGKVREFGVSNFRPSQLSLLQSALSFPLCVNQIEVSLLQLQSLEDGTLDQCQEKKSPRSLGVPWAADFSLTVARTSSPAKWSMNPPEWPLSSIGSRTNESFPKRSSPSLGS